MFEQIEQFVDPQKKYMVGDDLSMTYGEFILAVRRTAKFMNDSGLDVGSRMILATDQDDVFMIFMTAAMLCGIATVPLDQNMQIEEANYYLAASDPALIVGSAEYLAMLDIEQHAPATLIVCIGDPTKADAPNVRSAEFVDSGVARTGAWQIFDDATTSHIMFTSGTTSQPKGIELSHRNLLTHMRTIINHYGLDDSSTIMSNIPLHHADGVFHSPFPAFLIGGRVVRGPAITMTNIESFVHYIPHEDVTHLIAVPTILVLLTTFGDLVKEYFQSPRFRFIVSTSAPLNETLWRDVENQLGAQVVNVYGLTETVLESLFCGPSRATRKLGTVGKPVDCETRIVDENGRDLGANEVGELLLRGDHIMKGYFGDPEQTSDVLRDGWLYTGDMAKVDDEGFFEIVGRKKNIIKVSGDLVYPDDATNVLRDHADVFDACSFGRPHRLMGELLVSCVILKDGSLVTSEDLIAFCKTRLSEFKVPREIHILETFPRGPSGKVKLKEIQELIAVL